MAVFDLNELFAQQFGYTPLQIEVKDSDLMNKRNAENGQYGSYYGTDVHGREVFMPLTINSLFLPYTWMSVSGSKTIVETELTEVDYGTVYEQVNLQPWRFSVKGLLIGQNGKFPEKELEELIRLYKTKEAVAVKSVLTDMHLIDAQNKSDKVVVFDYNLADNPGVKNVRGFTLELKSTREFSLILD